MCVEQAFGCLKRRFPALKTEIRLKTPVDICMLIHSGFILHNICVAQRDEADFPQFENEDEDNIDDVVNQALNNNAANIRDFLRDNMR